MTWIILYLAVGGAIFGILWKKFRIEWKVEESGTRFLMIATPVAWPVVLVIILGVWMMTK